MCDRLRLYHGVDCHPLDGGVELPKRLPAPVSSKREISAGKK